MDFFLQRRWKEKKGTNDNIWGPQSINRGNVHDFEDLSSCCQHDNRLVLGVPASASNNNNESPRYAQLLRPPKFHR